MALKLRICVKFASTFNVERVAVLTYDLVICKDSNDCLPANIRNIAKCEPSTFKHSLDRYLQTITDLPCVPNDDNSLDARIHEMRWCTPRGGLAN